MQHMSPDRSYPVEPGEPAPAAFDAIVAAPGFALGVRCNGAAVTEIVWLPSRQEQAGTSSLALETTRQLRAYLADPAFPFDLPLETPGTRFRQRVWQAIASIPKGEVRTYGELARALSSGPRAVGQACGDNPVPIVVPCHRVVAASGALGGFAHNRNGMMLDIKRWLLNHEGCPR